MEKSKNKKSYKKTKKMSLKLTFFLVILGCWILPIIILISMTGYFVLTNVKERTQESIMTSVDNAVKMTSTRIEASVNSSVAAAYRTEINDAYAQSKIDKDYITRYSAVKDHLEQQYKQDEKFIGTSVTFYDDMDTMCFTTNSEKGSVAPNFKKDTSEIIRLLGPVIGYDIKFFVSNDNLYMMRNIRDKSYVPYAVLCMQINDELMFNSMRNILMVNSVTVWIGDEEYKVLGDVDSTKYKDLTFKRNKSAMQETENGSLIYGEVEGDMYNMRYCVEADSNALLEELSEFTVVIIIMSAMMIPLLMLVVLFFYYKITRPINALTIAAKCVEEGDFTKKVEGKFTSQELSYLAETFDRMTDKLQNQFQKIYKEELALRDAKIMALQLQMNPHFLNNTLEIINWEARFAGDEKISRMLECLSVMLSATMDRKKQRIVHLEEELTYVDSYLYIISERLGKRLKINKEIDQSLLKHYVPRLILQPVIENAVEHGIQPLQEGLITIRAYIENDNILVEVENDGIMTNEDEEKIEQLLAPEIEGEDIEAENLGIRNVNKRLKIIYGEQGGLTIKMNKNQHTLAQITIPINQEQQPNAINGK